MEHHIETRGSDLREGLYRMAEEHFQTINRIVDELSQDEHRKLVYLCSDLRAGCCAGDARGMLRWLTSRAQVGPLFLMELVLKMRRFDILKKVLGTNRQDAEGLLGDECTVSEYRMLMADISENITKEDLRSLLFLLDGVLPRARQESAMSFLDVIEELEKLEKVSSEKLDLIEQCLRNIHRVDLARKVHQFQRKARHDLSMQNQRVGPPVIKRPQRCQQIPGPAQAPPTVCLHPVRAAARGNIKMPVPETGRQYCQGSLEMYRMQTNPRGVCVIIDCVGSGVMLEETFRRLSFTVSLHQWPGIMEMRAILEDVSTKRQWLREAGAFVCCIISRSSGTALLATEERGPGLTLGDVACLFRTDACRDLVGKPKLFFIQSYSVPEQDQAARCYGNGDDDLETDGPTIAIHSESVPSDADFFWSHCSAKACQLEEGRHESVYLKALCNALLNGQKRKMNLLDIHTEVNSVVYEHNHQNPGQMYSLSLRHTLRKCLFFP